MNFRTHQSIVVKRRTPQKIRIEKYLLFFLILNLLCDYLHSACCNQRSLFLYIIQALASLVTVAFTGAERMPVHLGIHTSKSSVAGSDSALNLARGPNVSGADQCCAWLSGLPRTSKLQVNKSHKNILTN